MHCVNLFRVKGRRLAAAVTAGALVAGLASCGDDTTPKPARYTVGGTVAGLAGGSLVLVNNEEDALSISANGPYTFTIPSEGAGEYSVVLATQPPGQTCTLAQASGAITNANITHVDVTCSASGASALYAFSGGADGSYPDSGLTAGPDGDFYGTTTYGGSSNLGTVYRITPRGAHTVIHSFAAGVSEGQKPASGLELGNDGAFYATTTAGGTYGKGTFFRIDTAGNVTTLFSFGAPGTGVTPQGVTLMDDGNFYGTTTGGGANNLGTVYRITAKGAHTVLYSFKPAPEGHSPSAGLSPSPDGFLYGVTYYGGSANGGTLFRIAQDGSGYTTLHAFAGGASDGKFPGTKLRTGPDGHLYGSTGAGGSANLGTLFRYDRGAATFTLLHSFMGAPNDGSFPSSRLRLGPDGGLYGVSFYGGYFDAGTFFRLGLDGKVKVLYSFAGGNDGQSPNSSLLVTEAGEFYGTTIMGGPTNNGTLYKFTLQ